MNAIFNNNEVLFKRNEDLIRITACAENSLRFEAFPDGEFFEENFTLMPKSLNLEINEKENKVEIKNGALSAVLESRGKITFFKNGVPLLEENNELAFDSGWRFYESNENNTYYARATFKPARNEHFYGLGHEASNQFDLKGSSFDLRHVNAKCSIPLFIPPSATALSGIIPPSEMLNFQTTERAGLLLQQEKSTMLLSQAIRRKFQKRLPI